MDPFATLDTFAEVIADAVAEAMMKTEVVAGCLGLSAVCLAIIVARRARR